MVWASRLEGLWRFASRLGKRPLMKDLNRPERPTAGQVAILGGSAAAREIARRLAGHARLWLPSRDRVTGQTASFGFETWVRGAAGILIAPHPCDIASLALGNRSARRLGLPSLTVMRTAWQAERRDRWVSSRTVAEAVAQIPSGARVLVTLGRSVMPELSAFRHAHAFVRQLNRHDQAFPLRHGRYLFDAPPFTVASEVALMRKYRIDAVLTRNAGGPGGWPKVAAARVLGIPVYMINREASAGGRTVQTVNEAVEWGRAQVWLDV